jgi:hypothetical protein
MRRIIIILSFLLSPAATKAVDSFDFSTGQLSIPQVIVGDTKYFDLIVTINSLVSGGELTSPLATTNLGPRPDTFDLKRGQLIIPAVTVGNTVYKNLILTIGEVVYFSGKTEVVGGDPGFNGALYPEPYELILASDVPESVGEGIRASLDAAVRIWGNFGPLEYWIVGSDASATRELEAQFCKRPDGRFGSETSCLEWVERTGAFEELRLITIRMLEGNLESSVGLRGGLPSKVIIGSTPPALSGINFLPPYQLLAQSTQGKVELHEYWHAIQWSHFNHEKTAEQNLGPTWWVEGTAEYMAIITHSKLKTEEKLIFPDMPQYSGLLAMKGFMDEAIGGGVRDASFSVKEIPSSSQLKYAVGAWATAFLLNRVGDSDILLNVFLPTTSELGWEGAFIKTFGITPDTFYTEFDAFLLLPYDEQVKILDPSLIEDAADAAAAKVIADAVAVKAIADAAAAKVIADAAAADAAAAKVIAVAAAKVIAEGIGENSIIFDFFVHESIPVFYKNDFYEAMKNLRGFLPLEATNRINYLDVYVWNNTVDTPYCVAGDTKLCRNGSSISANKTVFNRGITGPNYWMQLEINNREFQYVDAHLYTVIAHETYHVYQISAAQKEMKIKWLFEGSAATFESLYSQEFLETDYFPAQTLINDSYIDDPQVLEAYASQDPNYSSSVFLILVLSKELQAQGYSEAEAFKLILKDFWDRSPSNENWKELFQELFQMSPANFYKKVSDYETRNILDITPSKNLKLSDLFKDKDNG